jgi:hypothetical protein
MREGQEPEGKKLQAGGYGLGATGYGQKRICSDPSPLSVAARLLPLPLASCFLPVASHPPRLTLPTPCACSTHY